MGFVLQKIQKKTIFRTSHKYKKYLMNIRFVLSHFSDKKSVFYTFLT